MSAATATGVDAGQVLYRLKGQLTINNKVRDATCLSFAIFFPELQRSFHAQIPVREF
jgi:hypothetical protein